ncbi:MAG: PqqD family protein [Armatimonadetes bacterium]|nr:PqqD family protein [Armatimonadota bacterium]
MRVPLKWKLYTAVGRYLPFLKIKPPEVDRKAAMTLRPGRNSLLTWEAQESGKTLLKVPVNLQSGRVKKRLAQWMKVPNERTVELDEVGAYVWELCDGKHTVEQIVQLTAGAYKMNRREAEVSVTMFLQMLHERNFIGFYKRTAKKARKG